MNVLWGYVASYGYLFAVIFVCGLLQKRNVLSGELSRKAIHILIAFTWCLMDVFWGRSYHQIIISSTFVIINFLSYKFKFLSGVERAGKSHAGTVYYALAMLVLSIASFLYEPLYYPFGAAVFVLSFGDGFAPIFGSLKVGNKPLAGKKTLFGTMACFTFGAAALAVFSSSYELGLAPEEIIALGVLSSLIELFSINGLDNFTVSFSVMASVLAAYYDVFTQAFWICVSLSFIMVVAALYFNALTAIAAAVSEVFMIVSAYVCDWTVFLVYVLPFFIISIAGLMKRKKGKTSQGRKTRQVLINGAPALLGFLLFKIYADEAFFLLGAAALCSCFSDSCASDFGYFSNQTPYDFIKRKKVAKGLSGGITLLGSVACVLGAAVVAAISLINRPLSFVPLFVFAGGILGCFFDTVLGSLFQALYRYPIPKDPDESGANEYGYSETPVPYKNAVLIKGSKWVNNDLVNLFSSVIASTSVFAIHMLVF